MGPTFTFDWHEESEDSFYKWMIPTLIAEMSKDGFEALSVTTDGFKRVELGITINGVPVNAAQMVSSLEHNFHHSVAMKAEEVIRDIRLDKLAEALADAESAALRVLRRRLEDIGVELPQEED